MTVGIGAPFDKIPLYVDANQIAMGTWVAVGIFSGLLTLLTGGRVWWISREARRQMGMPTHAKYKAIVAAILESGMLYTTTLMAATLIPLIIDRQAHGIIPVDLTVVSTLMSGLAPTLIIVRVAYGKSVDSVHQMVSIHFAERESQQGPQLSVLRATMDISSRPPVRASGVHIGSVKPEDKIGEDKMV
ncbi:hypothetical protein PM082_002241 [Marasmius tenuissimus]|nr:hypothetical protein PM082_002241 [Marasmius tenuissimus]